MHRQLARTLAIMVAVVVAAAGMGSSDLMATTIHSRLALVALAVLVASLAWQDPQQQEEEEEEGEMQTL